MRTRAKAADYAQGPARAAVVLAQQTGCPVSSVVTPFPGPSPPHWQLPQHGAPWNSRWGCLVPWRNEMAKSHHWKAANPPRHPKLNLFPGAAFLIYLESLQAPFVQASEMSYSFQTLMAHLRQLYWSLSLNFPITGSKYCWDSVIARLQPISITDEV